MSMFRGIQQSTDVSLTTPVWLSSTMTSTFSNIFPASCCQTRRGLDWWNHGGCGRISV